MKAAKDSIQKTNLSGRTYSIFNQIKFMNGVVLTFPLSSVINMWDEGRQQGTKSKMDDNSL